MTCYCSTDEARSILGASQPAGGFALTVDTPTLLSNIRVVTTEIDNKFPPPQGQPRWPMFQPYLGTRKIRIVPQNINSNDNNLFFNMPLLRLDSVVLNGTTFTVGTQVQPYPDPSYPPWYAINLMMFYPLWYDFALPLLSPTFVFITGIWGFSRDFANAWLAVDALQADITSSQTTLTVASVSGSDAYGAPNRISPGHLLQIDAEWMEAITVNTATNVVTVRRGVNGTTAAAHTNTTTVSRWLVEDPVKRASARQSGLMYARFGAYTTTEVQGMGTEIRFPNHWLGEVNAMLAGYQYE